MHKERQVKHTTYEFLAHKVQEYERYRGNQTHQLRFTLALTAVCLIFVSCHAMVGNLSQPLPQPKRGTISENEIWSGVIKVDDDVIVPSGVSLKILPGTTVIFASKDLDKNKLKLIIHGGMTAEGTIRQPIKFQSDYKHPLQTEGWWRNSTWQGIIISSADSSPTHVIRHCIIDNAYVGIDMKDAQVIVTESRIRRVEHASIECARGKLELTETELVNGQFGVHGSSTVLIARKNSIRDHQFGIGGSYVHASISENTFYGNAGGIDIQALTNEIEISHNEFHRCGDGITLGVHDVSVLIERNEFKEGSHKNVLFRGRGTARLKKNRSRYGAYGIYVEGEPNNRVTVVGSINDSSDPDTNTMRYMRDGNVYPYDYVLQRNGLSGLTRIKNEKNP